MRLAPLLLLLGVLAFGCDHEDEEKSAPAVDPIIAPLLTAKNLGPPMPPRTGTSAVLPPLAPSASPARRVTRRDAGADAGPPACGEPPLPDCPLKRWMKENTVVPVLAPDFPDLVTAFEKIATFAPTAPGYPYWRSISLDGASAAQDYDLEAVHAACRGCHTQYLAKYKAELRPEPLPE